MAGEEESQRQIDVSSDTLSLSSWGLPEAILAQYESCGVKSMFPWQAECLLLGDVLNGENLVFSAPTSAGKSLIAEILMLKRVLENRKKALLIVPFISMAKEKVVHLQDLYRNVDLRVGGFMGNTSAPGGFKSTDVLICTIEKANSMINRLMEADRLSEIGIIVVDEIHLLGDSSRGYLLELLLTKILYSSRQMTDGSSSKNAPHVTEAPVDELPTSQNAAGAAKVQIVGMSATLPNVDVVANWLQARLYRSDFRPVPLTQMMKVGPVVYDSRLSAVRTLPQDIGLNEDGDHAVQLTLETITTGHSVLIFCPSRDWCENLAQKIAKDVMAVGSARESALLGFEFLRAARQGLRTHLDGVQLESLIEELRDSTAGLDPVLRRTISSGVAFHHAGLTVEERDVVESGFRRGILKVLVATSTLSSGVNLPARRVLIRSPYAGGTRLLDSLVYHQMIGRAGRTGVDTVGESILMCKETEKNAGCELMTDGLRPIDSCLKRDGERLSSALKRAILEIVVNGVADSVDNVKTYVGCTLLAALAKCNQESGVERCMQELFDAELIRVEKDPDKNIAKYVATALGKAVVSAALPPDEGIALYNELDRARRGLLLENDLHLLYQVTPLSAVSQVQKMDWFLYRTIWHSLPENMRRVGEAVGVDDGFLFRCLKGFFRNNERSEELTIHARFYSALALNELANEIPLKDVAEKYGFNRGYLQSLQQSAATYAGMVSVFCDKLGWKNMELLVSQFQSRLNFGVSRELVDLMQISSLDSKIARALFESGVETCADLTATHPAIVEKFLCTTGPFSKGKTVWRQGMGHISVSKAAALIVQEAKAVVERRLGRHVNIRWAIQTVIEEPQPSARPEASPPSATTLPEAVPQMPQNPEPEAHQKSEPEAALETETAAVDVQIPERSTETSENEVPLEPAAKREEMLENAQLAEESQLLSQELFEDSSPSVPVSPKAQLGEENGGKEQSNSNQPAVEQRRSLPPRKSMDPSEFDEDLFEGDVTWPSLTATQVMEEEKVSKEPRQSLSMEKEEAAKEEDMSLFDDSKMEALNQAIQESSCEDPRRKSLAGKIGEEENEKEMQQLLPIHGERESVEVSPLKVPSQAGPIFDSDSSRRSLPGQKDQSLDWNESISDTMLNEVAKDAENPRSVETKKQPSWEVLNCTVSESMIQFMMEVAEDPRAVEDSQLASSPTLPSSAAAKISDLHTELDDSVFSKSMLQQLIAAEDQNAVNVQGTPVKTSGVGLEGAVKVELEEYLGSNAVAKLLSPELVEAVGNGSDACSGFHDSLFSDSIVQQLIQMDGKGPENVEERKKDGSTQEAIKTPVVVGEQEVMDVDVMGGSFSTSMMQLIAKMDPVSGPTKCDPVTALREQPEENGNLDLLMSTMTDTMMMELNVAEEAVCKKEPMQAATNMPSTLAVVDKALKSDTQCEMPSISDSVMEEMMAMDCGENDRVLAKAAETPTGYHLRPRTSRRSTSGKRKSSVPCEIPPSAASSSTPVFARIVTDYKRRSSGRSSGSGDVVNPSPEIVGTSADKGKNKSKLMHHRRKHLKKRKRQAGSSSEVFSPPTLKSSKVSKYDSTIEDSKCPEQSTTTDAFPVSIDLVPDSSSVDLKKLVDTWSETQLFSLCLACIDVEVETKSVVASKRIGSKFQQRGMSGITQQGGSEDPQVDSEQLMAVISGGNRRRKLTGIAVCLEGEVARFLSLDNVEDKKAGVSLDEKLGAIRSLLRGPVSTERREERTLVMFEVRSQLRVIWQIVFQKKLEVFPGQNCQLVDPKVAAWYMDAGMGEPCFEHLVGQLPGNHQEILSALVAHDGVGSVGLTTKSKSPDDAMKNACVEAVLVFKLWQYLKDRLKGGEGHRGFYSIESPCMVAVAKMESHGFGFDIRRCLELRKALETKRENLAKLASKAAGRVFNLSSRRKLTQVLTEALGKVKAAAPDKPCLTITGNSLDKEVLQAAAKFHPLPEYILKWRKIGMALTQFVVPFSGGDLIGRHWNAGKNNASSTLDDCGRRIHADWEYFTASGRLATRDPNLQTIFKDFEAAGETFSLRSMFVPRVENGGGILIAGDYSQMDLRILAHLANDSALLSHLNADCDVLRVVAGAHLRKDPQQVNDEERQSTKQVVYGIIYGVGAASLARQLDTTESEAQKLMNTFLDRYPGIKRYIRSQIETVRSCGFVQTLSGRRRHLPGMNSESVAERGHAERQAVHTAVQGSAADLLKAAMVVTERAFKKEFPSASVTPRLVMSLHDELIFEAPKALGVDRSAACLEEAMESAWLSCTGVELRVKTPVKTCVGESWGSLIPWGRTS